MGKCGTEWKNSMEEGESFTALVFAILCVCLRTRCARRKMYQSYAISLQNHAYI